MITTFCLPGEHLGSPDEGIAEVPDANMPTHTLQMRAEDEVRSVVLALAIPPQCGKTPSREKEPAMRISTSMNEAPVATHGPAGALPRARSRTVDATSGRHQQFDIYGYRSSPHEKHCQIFDFASCGERSATCAGGLPARQPELAPTPGLTPPALSTD